MQPKMQDNTDFNKFIKLVEDQFLYGGKKYALNDERESTDVLFDKHGKNWLFGTIDKYTYRFRNLARECDLLKIATYVYILWLKRGFHVMRTGINDPPLDTNIQQKVKNFNVFVERVKQYHLEKINNPFYVAIRALSESYSDEELNKAKDLRIIGLLGRISDSLKEYSKTEWKKIEEYTLFCIFDNAFSVWEEKFTDVINHDTDTDNERKEINHEKSRTRKK